MLQLQNISRADISSKRPLASLESNFCVKIRLHGTLDSAMGIISRALDYKRPNGT